MPTKVVHTRGPGITKVVLTTTKGQVVLDRPDGRVARLEIPKAPISTVALTRRTLAEQLAEELRRLDPDEIYLQALKGVDHIAHDAHGLTGIDLKKAPAKKSTAKKSTAQPVKGKKSVAKSAGAKKPAQPVAKKTAKPAKKSTAAKKSTTRKGPSA